MNKINPKTIFLRYPDSISKNAKVRTSRQSGYLRKMVFGFILFILMALQIPRWRCALLILLCKVRTSRPCLYRNNSSSIRIIPLTQASALYIQCKVSGNYFDIDRADWCGLWHSSRLNPDTSGKWSLGLSCSILGQETQETDTKLGQMA
jgi:hypothetical protein